MSRAPLILLVNPWITDFAAHDLWAKPMGLLLLGNLLREGGCGVAVIDCLDRHDPHTHGSVGLMAGKDGAYGTGKYPRAVIPKPEVYAQIPRRYHRYGIHPESFIRRALDLPKPDLVWVTSHMTYWYPGVLETIRLLKELFPGVPVWLGGIYAALCRSHAEAISGADWVAACRLDELPARIEAAVGFRPANEPSWNPSRSPALDLLPQIDYVPILTGLGCPYRCPYCASSILQPVHVKRRGDAVLEEIVRWRRDHGVRDFAFYDDALLLNADRSLKPALVHLAREGTDVRFHTPNALHVRALTREWCDLLFAAGFRTIRLGLETTNRRRQREWGGKVETETFLWAVENLMRSGFTAKNIGVYLMAGLPAQTVQEVRESIEFVHAAGVQPYLSEYSPVPGTSLWKEACRVSPFDLASEPLTHNNTFLACRRHDFTLEDLQRLKSLALEARRKLDPPKRSGDAPGSREESRRPEFDS